METIGLVIFASLFVVSGVNHIRNHRAMAGYTAATLGNIPLAEQLGFLGGWPTGVVLVGLGIGAAAFQDAIFFYGIAAFLALATLLFHRESLKDPGTQKGVALLGSALALATLVK